MKINEETLKAFIVIMIFALVLFSLAASVLPTTIKSAHNLTESLENGADYLGTAPAALAGTVDDNMGYFWIIGVVLVIIAVAMGWYTVNKKRYGKYGRR